MSKYFAAAFFVGILACMYSCNVDEEPEYVFPGDYFPAYPGSYWDYTNGSRVIVEKNYSLHSYQPDISSAQKTAEKYVPEINGKFLYKYSITQSSTKYPLKKLLDETSKEKWLVNEINNVKIYRQVVETIDSMYINFPPFTQNNDSTKFKNVLVVVEFMDSLKADRWNVKEFYAKNVGLIRRELDNPLDGKAAIVEKEIQAYFIDN
jgi:hypothetical protein